MFKISTRISVSLMCSIGFICLGFTACSTNETYMKASIDGDKWDLADEQENVNYRAEYNEIEHKLSVQGWCNDPRYISEIRIKIEHPRKGTFQLGTGVHNKAKVWLIDEGEKKVYDTDMEACKGSVKITEFSNSHVAGRFSFTAVSQKGEKLEVTGGRFGMPLDLLDF